VCPEVAAPDLARDLHPQDGGRLRACRIVDAYPATDHLDVVGIDDDTGPGNDDETAAADVGIHAEDGAGNHSIGEVEPDVATGDPDLHPPGHRPPARPAGSPAFAENPHNVLGRGRGQIHSTVRPGRQVTSQDGELALRAGCQGGLEPLVKLLGCQPAVARRDPEELHDSVAVRVRGPQLWPAVA
jgi:hypothetical protein